MIGKKKIINILGIMAAVCLIGVAASFYLTMPSTILAMDINPSIELKVNRLNQVVEVIPVNADAKQVMSGYKLTDRNLEDVIDEIVNRMIYNGYLVQGKENEILITAQEDSSSKIIEPVSAEIKSSLKDLDIQVIVYQQTVKMADNELEVAQSNEISFGKMALIDNLIKQKSSLTVNDLSSLSVKELIQVAKTNMLDLSVLANDDNEGNEISDDGNLNATEEVPKEIAESELAEKVNETDTTDVVSSASVTSETEDAVKNIASGEQKLSQNKSTDVVSGASYVEKKTSSDGNTTGTLSKTKKTALKTKEQSNKTDAVSGASVSSKSDKNKSENYENEDDDKYNEDEDKYDEDKYDDDEDDDEDDDDKDDKDRYENDDEDDEDNDHEDEDSNEDSNEDNGDQQHENEEGED